MNRTKIPYLQFSWNPLAMRCTPCSPGCANCWHLAMENRFCYVGSAAPGLREKELLAPLHHKKPARIGVQFMGDLFHEDVPDTMISEVFSIITLANRHTFLMLTKRPERAADYATRWAVAHDTDHLVSNLWLGVTVCNQSEADAKAVELLQIPAAVRWLSIEPMLEGIEVEGPHLSLLRDLGRPGAKPVQRGIDWVVVGCESGPHRRPCNIEWVRAVVEQCKAAQVPCFVKQLDIEGKVVDDPAQFPEDLRIREYPEAQP